MNRFVLLAFAGTLGLAACADQPLAPIDQPDLVSARAASASSSAGGRTIHRSVQEFLAAQGTYCALQPENCFPIMAPLPELAVWFDWINGASTTAAIVDYAGVADTWLRQRGGPSLGTETEGTVTERVLKDGRVEVHVIVRTRNALAYAGSSEYLSGDPLFFGATAPEVLAGATPALASSILQIKYITTAPGLPFPDLLQIAFAPQPGQEVLQVKFHAQAQGMLRAASGFPEGTMGQLLVQQVGIFHTKSPVKANDPFPVEFIKLRPIGR